MIDYETKKYFQMLLSEGYDPGVCKYTNLHRKQHLKVIISLSTISLYLVLPRTFQRNN